MDWLILLTTFGFSTGLSLLFVPVARSFAFRTGRVVSPRRDRWHRRPTPIFGGVVMYLAFLGAVLLSDWLSGDIVNLHGLAGLRWGLLTGSSLMLGIGLLDDLRPLSPPAKLVGQISAAALVVFFGGVIDFFPWGFANLLLTFVWLVGITNAINLLDNMDGLAGGIALIAAGFLAYFFWKGANQPMLLMAVALIGSLLGFLVYNFPPARIFMGDSGSLFLGFTLAALAVVHRPRASDVFSVLGVPMLLFLLPILDTLLVTVTRLLRGQSPTQGGADHTSHRLIAFGLSERQTVLFLYAVGLLSGVVGAVLEALDYDLSLVLIPILLVSLSLVTAYLSRLKMVSSHNASPGALTRLMVDLTYKHRVFEMFLDFFVIGASYYLAFWTHHEFQVEGREMEAFLVSLPAVLPAAFLSFFVLGIYRGLWRYQGVEDLARYARASLVGVLLAVLILLVFRPSAQNSPAVYFLYGVFLFLGLATSRLSFRFLDRAYKRRQTSPETARVLIYGAEESGELALRWILNHSELGYIPAGILDDDPHTWGRVIHGVRVLGGCDQIDGVLVEQKPQGVIIASPAMLADEPAGDLIQACRKRGVWLKVMNLNFEEVE